MDLDDPETRNKIIAEAIDGEKLENRTWPELTFYEPNQQTPYTGWAKWMDDNGQIELDQLKDGTVVRLTSFNSNGQKQRAAAAGRSSGRKQQAEAASGSCRAKIPISAN